MAAEAERVLKSEAARSKLATVRDRDNRWFKVLFSAQLDANTRREFEIRPACVHPSKFQHSKMPRECNFEQNSLQELFTFVIAHDFSL